MDIVKDTVMEVGYLVWQVRPPRPSLTVVAKATFSLAADGPSVLAEEQHPVSGPVFYEDDPQRSMRLDTDLAVWKTRGECFLAGTCHPPGGKPASTSAVSFKVGSVSKTLAVFGDRAWSSLGVLSAPKPFTAMPLCYERSFGGPSIPANPLGSAVPNIEDPRELITSPRSRPKPAGAFPIPPDWKSRLKRAGNYDKKWLATRWPYFPEDFDGSFFNAAPEDQWIEGFWKGDEEIVLQNLHAQHPVLRTRLPALRARVLLQEKGTGLREVPLRLDTITVDADAGLAFVLWRGMVEVKTETLEEVDSLFVAHEPLGAPLSKEALQARFEQKLAERQKEEEDFEPEAPPPSPPPPKVAAAAPVAEPATLDPAALEAKLKKLIAVPPPRPPPKAAPPSAQSAEKLRKAFAAIGVEPSKELQALLAEIEAPDEATELTMPLVVEAEPRERLMRRLKAHESVAGQDWSGADLSGLDLRRVDLSGAILQGCSLRKARLDEAKLGGAVLAGADLTEASLKGASLEGADLTQVRAASSRFEEANLEGATLSGGDFSGASFQKAKCAGAQLVKARLSKADLREACLDEADLSEARLEDARLEGASLQDTELAGADATRANFDGANLTQLRASPGARMAQASFKRVQAAKSRWGGALLDEADFSFSELERSDFSGASLVKARFNGCNVPNSRFAGARMVGTSMLKANLFEGLFEAADLSHADLRGANLFGAEFWKAQTGSTRLELAILTRTKLADRVP
ncbi:DUF2169 domain-containing protein [Hyalangium sp.]|uniref:DUF2169 family type VI secretion system accessory protein n=1 Tax=Hyalangium sp. TaxID=2028555 RepID=UPI002D59E1EF|nr:DUF2169 domain-containing protein [Hyalangium sp.]HYH94573.1 DUF2169 domain-containing protein [Hyalangium sp.]